MYVDQSVLNAVMSHIVVRSIMSNASLKCIIFLQKECYSNDSSIIIGRVAIWSINDFSAHAIWSVNDFSAQKPVCLSLICLSACQAEILYNNQTDYLP